VQSQIIAYWPADAKTRNKKSPVGTRAGRVRKVRKVIKLPVQKQGNSVDKEPGGSFFIPSFLD
jgi:hypothetical protein